MKAAEPMLTESLALRRTQRGKSRPIIAESLVSLSSLRLEQMRCGEAVSLSREAVAMSRQFLLESHAFHAAAGLGLAVAPQPCGEAAEAAPLAQAALKILTALMPAGAWQLAEAKRLACRCQRRTDS